MSDLCKRGHPQTEENVYVRKGTGSRECRICRSIIKRRSRLRIRYDIDPDEYEEALRLQGAVCGICGTYEPGFQRGFFAVDHDHETGAVRGLLCHHCNLGLGHFKDEPRRLRSAVHYLERHAS